MLSVQNLEVVYQDVILVLRGVSFDWKELSEEENGIVEVFKSVNKLKTKQDAIKSMISHFEVTIKPKKVQNKEYFK